MALSNRSVCASSNNSRGRCACRSSRKAVVTKLGGALNAVSKELAFETTLRFLNRITAPGLKDAWPTAWRVLAETLRPEVAEALHVLEPVCDVLEGKERARSEE